MLDARYSHPAVLKYFCEVYCSPTLPDTHWHHHRTRRSKSQHILLTTSICYSTNGRPDDDNPTVPPPNMTRSVSRSRITAPTKPPFYDDIISKGKRSWPLTGPMISYCPPWLPPHRKCWYATNVDLNLRRPQPASYMNTPYYRRSTTQYGVDLSTPTTADTSYPVPPAPTASEKNMLRPP